METVRDLPFLPTESHLEVIFVQPCPDILRCQTCGHVVSRLHRGHCLHGYCLKCFEKSFAGRTIISCPVDDCPLMKEKMIVDQAIGAKISYLQVYCPNKELGCEATPRLCGLKIHLKSCLFAEVSCPLDCGLRTTRSKLNDHLLFECQAYSEPPVENNQPELSETDGPSISPCSLLPIGCTVVEPQEELEEHEKCTDGQSDSLTVRLDKQNDEREEPQEVLEEHEKCTDGQLDPLTVRLDKQSDEREEIPVEREQTQKELVQLKDAVEDLTTTFCSTSQALQWSIDNLAEEVHKLRLTGMEPKVDSLSNIDEQFKDPPTGLFVWVIQKYSIAKREEQRGKRARHVSDPFYISKPGFKLRLEVHLNGYDSARGSHLSLFVVVLRGKYDDKIGKTFRQKMTIMIADQTGRGEHKWQIFDTYKSFPIYEKCKACSPGLGWGKMISHKDLEAPDSPYLIGDKIIIKAIAKPPPVGCPCPQFMVR